MVWIPAITEMVLGTLAFFPFLRHRISISKWLKKPNNYPGKPSTEPVTILLPVWNEAKIIQMKLDSLSNNIEMKTSLLVIDSASTDETVKIVKQWFEDNNSVFDSMELIEMEERLGKTTAVHRALTHLNDTGFDGLVLMTDADATITKGTVERMDGWFCDPTIGAVGAGAIRKLGGLEEQKYRSMFEMIRQGESNYDSTPFLEGSCMMWRASALDLSLLDTSSNADDAQIATAVRLSGLRSIFDNNSTFEDVAPPTIEGQRRQKIRRAQGLQRMLSANKKKISSLQSRKFKKIFLTEHYLHLRSPILALGVGLAGLSRWILVSFAGMPLGLDAGVHASLALIELLCLSSWLCMRQGIRLPLIGKIGTILTGLEYLLIARFNTLKGCSLHLWQQHSDTRDIISKSN